MILVPTLNRVKLLDRFLKSVIETAPNSKGIVIIDKKDRELNSEHYDKLQLPGNWFTFISESVSMGDKIREVWPEIKASKWIGLLNDDHICVTPQWDKILGELIDGTNMVSSNDGFWNFGFRVCGVTAFSKPLLDAAGFHIFPRRLQHLYIDDIWKAIGEASGCWQETMRLDFPHKHTLKGEMDQDETHKKVYAPGSWEFDSKEYKDFMEQDFKGVVDRILTLRAQANEGSKFV